MSYFAINEDFLQQVETLQLIIKNNIAGLFGGNHQSRTYGSSCEFADYRDYIPGDDLTKIDWNAYARFEKLYLKLFLDERQVHTRIYIDASRSMNFGKTKKAEKALQIAATLAYLSICEMDKVSIYVIKENKVHEVISKIVGKESYFNTIGKLNDIVFEGDSFISESILPTTVGYGDGLSVIISDFLTDNNYEDAIDYLVGKKRDVLCIQLLSTEEVKPSIRGKVQFIDSENNEDIYKKDISKDIVKAYHEALDYCTGRIKNYCFSRDAKYLLASDDKTMQEIFLGRLPELEVLK